MRPLVLVLVLVLVACRPTPKVQDVNAGFPEERPVIDAQPVDTKSFDAGYQAGRPNGVAAASPRAKLPSQDEVDRLAAVAAGDDPAHNKKWRNGWASGYLEGFRSRAFKIK